jgi:signal transduction histidine kinase
MIRSVPATLASRFLLTLLLTAITPFLLFGWFSLRAMRGLIDEQVVSVFLPQLARDHAKKIEDRLQQIAQACAIVREMARTALDRPEALVDFETQVDPVPDLLDNFLDLLLLARPDGAVAYWQEGHRLDPTTRGRRAALIPKQVGDMTWFERGQRGGTTWLSWSRSPYLHGGLEHRSMNPADYHLGLVLDVPRPQGPPGVLLALIRWPEVQQVLDRAREVLAGAGFPSAQVFLADRQGLVQACTDRSRYGLPLDPPELWQAMVAEPGGRTTFADASGTPFGAGFARVGSAPDPTWLLGLFLPTAELFAPSRSFERGLVLALLATVLILAIWALMASRAIARPVQRLARATERIAHGELDVRVAEGGAREFTELGRAFNRMARDLAEGRERLKVAERQAAWAEMARQVAHEVKNPLTPMRMAAQLLLQARREGDPRADELAERLAQNVMAQTEALDRIASDFRQFAGAPVAQREVVPVPELLAEVRRVWPLPEDGLELLVEVTPAAAVLRVAVDRRELGRVFLNLLQNAQQASARCVTIAGDVDGTRAAFTIVDDGSGVPEAARARLFEPYFTTRSSGTGLGLAICRRVVEAHGGEIALLGSEPGRTAFRILLPQAPG